jgi:hypothetical protein
MPTVDLSAARWRKSTYTAAAADAACVEVAPVEAAWRKSTHSTDAIDAACVEVAFTGPGAAIRDSKNPTAPGLLLPAPAFTALLRHA